MDGRPSPSNGVRRIRADSFVLIGAVNMRLARGAGRSPSEASRCFATRWDGGRPASNALAFRDESSIPTHRAFTVTGERNSPGSAGSTSAAIFHARRLGIVTSSRRRIMRPSRTTMTAMAMLMILLPIKSGAEKRQDEMVMCFNERRGMQRIECHGRMNPRKIYSSHAYMSGRTHPISNVDLLDVHRGCALPVAEKSR